MKHALNMHSAGFRTQASTGGSTIQVTTLNKNKLKLRSEKNREVPRLYGNVDTYPKYSHSVQPPLR